MPKEGSLQPGVQHRFLSNNLFYGKNHSAARAVLKGTVALDDFLH